MEIEPFIIRVYGIYINGEQSLLASDEFIFNRYITKFPGGGLQYGEGPLDCLKREMIEETGQEFEVLDHFYTTDFFLPSAFHEKAQIISIYYRMRPVQPLKFRTTSNKFDFENAADENQSFRWIPMDQLEQEDFTLPADQWVAGLIKRSQV